ncbi:MAG: dihydrolipoyl dehydrogenase [Solirubrobacteraceae bacterium]|nr:MAG: dihydrolipoyl dehydrogenase [Solirubrobacterales bacterium]
MADSAFDCIVIGSGPGGYVTAIRAAQLGMAAAVIEREEVVGGRCLNNACIPAKAVLRSADVLSEIDHAQDFGITVPERSVDFPAVAARRSKVIETLTGGVAGLFKKHKVKVTHGAAALTADGKVAVNDEQLEAPTIVLATGSVALPIPGTEFGERVLDTAGAWLLGALPESIAVVGAGASGTEIASAYARLGSRVLLFDALDRVLPTEDADISRIAARGFKQQQIETHTGTLVTNVKPSANDVSFAHGDQEETVAYLAIAAGRGPDIEGLGLKEAGIELDEQGLIAVDGAQKTSRDGVYAIGDLVHGPALAHKASDEGIIAVEDAAGMETHGLAYEDIPRATFCQPNVGSFGLTEEQAKAAGHDVVVGKVPYGAVGAGTVYGDRNGMIKLVGETKYGELLGGHIVGTRAVELVAELVTARALEGGFAEVARIVHGHPTLSEAVMEAARATDGWLIHG